MSLPFACDIDRLQMFMRAILAPTARNPKTLKVFLRAIHDEDPPQVTLVLPWLVRFGSDRPRLVVIGTTQASPRLQHVVLTVTDGCANLRPMRMSDDLRIVRQAFRYGPLSERNLREWPRLAVSRDFVHLYHAPSRTLRVRSKIAMTAGYNKHGLLGSI